MADLIPDETASQAELRGWAFPGLSTTLHHVGWSSGLGCRFDPSLALLYAISNAKKSFPPFLPGALTRKSQGYKTD